jgi:hypothetical protein
MKKGQEMVSKSIRVNPELWHKARVKALSENMTMQDLVEMQLKIYLKKSKKGG